MVTSTPTLGQLKPIGGKPDSLAPVKSAASKQLGPLTGLDKV